ncbi:hypothetical protein NCAS_0F03910 [Naumovozyma castellii]|uniref:Very-long-chain (3R)-3-hydroxyacyl-CoA dehydratase n=1 Tax=Naumovozyma castellii TaxID=27288 RepID=G0VHA2_NAUCA|nr:hypothetical protein NCAS_0F03910 [Naumovozyma castellii CBS 4309]CCC70875.1 hypothetical protein NCAS_0F03910 [Naumovozyma castellii CBS 4309]
MATSSDSNTAAVTGDPASRRPIEPKTPFIYKLYQYYQLSTSFLFAALLARWLIIFPLAGARFLPGGVHEFLCYLMIYASVGEIIWLFKFYPLKSVIFSKTLLKDLNFIYFVLVLHFYDDYEHALVLKNISYSVFIIGLSLNQAYHHWCKLFKRSGRKKNTLVFKVNNLLGSPLLYLSEYYLLLLNVQNPNFHSTPLLDIINRIILIIYFPIALAVYRNQAYK